MTPRRTHSTLAPPREGNKTPKKEPGPVIFVLKPKPHARFVRRGSDLVHKVRCRGRVATGRFSYRDQLGGATRGESVMAVMVGVRSPSGCPA